MSTIHSPLSAESIAAATRRIAALRLQLQQDGRCDALLVSNERDIQYLTGFVGHDSLLLIETVESHPPVIISDPRYDEFLDPWRKAGTVQVHMGVRHRLALSVRELCGARSVRRLGVQADHMTIAARARLAEAIGAAITIVDLQGLIAALRQRKDALEISLIERAIAIQEQALAAALQQITLGMTELQFSALLEFEMKSRGSQGTGFTPIIGAGPNSSIIHHMTGSAAIDAGVLLVDWGASLDGYNGDLTRTFGIGDMPAKIRDIYAVVHEAQQRAIDAIAPGKICAEIDAIARKVITDAGYGEYFGHGLGHGLGMDVHESPYFNNLETSTALEPGMVMTVEPGIYLPGVGGVRIEDDVLITESSCRVLSSFPKDLPSGIIAPATGQTNRVSRPKPQRAPISAA